MASTKTTSAIAFRCGGCGAANRIPLRRLMELKKSPQCGKCDAALLSLFDKPLTGVPAPCYVHPLDQEALQALQRVPGVQTILKALIRHSFELAARLHHEASFIRVSKSQLPKLWDLFCTAHARLGMSDDLPQLYVYQSPVPNAYTFGVDRTVVAVSTGCLELMDDDELLCVLGHELGHVHADHVLYKTASRVLGSVASSVAQATFGLGGVVLYPVQAALLRWDRASELSSDRAALLVVRKPAVVVRTLMKLAGGSPKVTKQLDLDAFVQQAEAFEKIKAEGPLGRHLSLLNELFRSHPYPIWRAKELLEWVKEGNFLHILDGDYDVADVVSSPSKKRKKSGSSRKGGLDKTWRDVQKWYEKTFDLPGIAEGKA
ncbi:MAG: M48 family metalloprotease [Myxococcota bacterium]